LFVLCLPYWQSILFAGISGSLSLLCLTCLLLFVVERSPETYQIVVTCLQAFPLSWVVPVLECKIRLISTPLKSAASGVGLVPSFQRPPPLLS
jgi:hypothetical protein